MIDINGIKPVGKNAIVIRHADRDRMEHGQIFQSLNDEGRKNAENLGKQLSKFSFSTVKFYSSPVDRCIETCECMQKGFSGNSVVSEISDKLGEPGPFVIDRKNNAFGSLSCHKVVVKQIERENLLGIRSLDEGSKILMDYVLEKLQSASESELLVFVTHDAIVAPFIFKYTGEKFSKEHWIDFSDGIAINLHDGNLSVSRNGQTFAV